MEDKFIALFKEILDMEDQELKLEDTFRDYDNWDSLANLSVIAMLDDGFGVHIENSEFKKLLTVNDLITAIKAKMA